MAPFDGGPPRAEDASAMADGESKAQVDKAIAEWAETVAGAAPWGEAWSQMTDFERRIISVIHNAALTLREVREGTADERDLLWLQELIAVKQDRPDTVKLALAARIVSECAQHTTPSLRDVPDPEAVDWPRLCIGMLTNEVHKDFHSLPVEAVGALLARFTNTMDRQGGKLTAAGILAELNALAGYPFGQTLTAKHINDASRRAL